MLPQDPIMLLSYINTKLRDEFSSLDALCEDMHIDPQMLATRLGCVNYTYDPALNRFV